LKHCEYKSQISFILFHLFKFLQQGRRLFFIAERPVTKGCKAHGAVGAEAGTAIQVTIGKDLTFEQLSVKASDVKI
jgi:hypothetical protein